MRLIVVGGGIDVTAAGEDQPVETVKHPRGDLGVDGLRWEQGGDPAGPGDRIQVGLVQKSGWNIPRSGLRLLQIGGQPNDRKAARRVRSVQSHAPAPSL